MPVVPITKQPTPGRKGAPQPSTPMPPEPFQLMAAAQMHAEGRLIQPGTSAEEGVARSQGSVRFDPEAATEGGKKLLEKLPDDMERIDRGSTIELRMKKKAQEDLTS